jgi:hypothetical protein
MQGGGPVRLAAVLDEVRINKARVSQRKMAADCGVSVNSLSQMICQHKPVDPGLVLKIGRKHNSNKALMEAVREWSGGMFPGWPDGQNVDPHRLAWLLVNKQEDSEADQARVLLERLLMAQRPDKERIASCLVELVEDAFTTLQLAGVAGEWAGINLATICQEVHERQQAAGLVRRDVG